MEPELEKPDLRKEQQSEDLRKRLEDLSLKYSDMEVKYKTMEQKFTEELKQAKQNNLYQQEKAKTLNNLALRFRDGVLY